MNKGIRFGTSGFRGIIGDNWTKENIRTIAHAFRQKAEADGKKVTIVVGYDNRFMGRESAEWFCEAVCSDKIQVIFMNVSVPTPFVAFGATTYDYGVIMTASHNPYFYNGIKVFLKGGKEMSDEFCLQLSQNIANPKGYPDANFSELVKSGRITLSDDTDDYVNKVVGLADAKTIRAAKIKVLFNPMNGSGSEITKKIFNKLGVNYQCMNDGIDPYFGGSLPCPYPHKLTDMVKRVLDGKFDLGIALDGDGDRIAVIDRDGRIYDCNYLHAILYYYLVAVKGQKGGIVKTTHCSNLGVRLCAKYGYESHEVPVGYKNIAPVLEQTNSLIGAESGGMGFKAVSLQKDGIAPAAVIIDLVSALKKGITELIKEVGALVDFQSEFLEYAYPFAAEAREKILEKFKGEPPKFAQKVIRREALGDGYKIIFEGDYWCMARVSGNENAARLYAEMSTSKECGEIIAKLEKHHGFSERQK